MSKVNFIKINFCDARDLYELPYVNKKRAQHIIHWRSCYGNLTPASLDEIKGVSRSTLEKHIDFTPNPAWGGNGLDTMEHSVSSLVVNKNLTAASSSRQLSPTPSRYTSYHQREVASHSRTRSSPTAAPGRSGPEYPDTYHGLSSRSNKSSSKGKSRRIRHPVESSESESEEESVSGRDSSDDDGDSSDVLREPVGVYQCRKNYP